MKLNHHPRINRKEFKIALASEGISQVEYARRLRPPASDAMIAMILSGRSWSKRIENEMRSFIDKHFDKLRNVA